MNNYFSIAGFCIGFINLCLALLISFLGKNKLHKVWSCVNYSISFWGFSMYVTGSTMNHGIAFLGCKMFTVGIALIALFYYHTIYIFCNLKSSRFLIFGYLESFFFILLTIFTNFMFGDKVFFSFNQFYYFRANFLYNFFMFIWSIVVGKSFYELYKYIRNSKGLTNIQAKYLFVAMLFGFGGGLNTAPAAWGFNIYPYGQIFVCIYGAVATYAIFRYRLMDIRLAVSNTAIFIGVYAFVLGVPFIFGYKYHQWQISTWTMLILATAGPVIFNYLRKQAEDKILEEQKRYRAILDTTSKNLNRFKTTEEIIQHICNVLYKSIGLKNVAFYIREGDCLLIRKTETNAGAYQEEIKNKEFMEYLTYKNQPIIIKEMHHNNHKNKQNINGIIQETQTEIAVPLVKSNRLVGLILLGEKNDGSLYSDGDIHTFNTISDHLAVAIENALYMEAEKRRNEEENKNKRQFQLDRFASSMAHQIRNPLNIIFQSVDDTESLVQKNRSNIKEEDYSLIEERNKDVKESCGRISRTIETILNFGKGTIELRKLKVSDVLNGFDILNKMILKKYGVKLNINTEETYPEVFGDVNLIEEALIIYLDNSCQAVSKNEIRKVDFKVYRVNGDYVRFEMSDNGHGIDEKTQKALFDVSTSTKGTEGNGLGLFRVRKICELIEGSKDGFFSGGRGQGAKFWIDLKISAN